MRTLITVAAVAAFAISGTSCRQATDSVVETLMEQEAKKFNKNGPTMIDEETRIDSIHVSEGRKLDYCYTLTNYAKEDLDVAVFRNTLEPTLKASVVNMKELEKLKDMDVIFNYKYFDKVGKPITEITLGPDDYKKK